MSSLALSGVDEILAFSKYLPSTSRISHSNVALQVLRPSRLDLQTGRIFTKALEFEASYRLHHVLDAQCRPAAKSQRASPASRKGKMGHARKTQGTSGPNSPRLNPFHSDYLVFPIGLLAARSRLQSQESPSTDSSRKSSASKPRRVLLWHA